MSSLILERRAKELSYAWGYIVYEEAPSSIYKAREIIGGGRVITIGDVVTRNFARYFKTDVAVIDNYSRREKMEGETLEEDFTCHNPAGSISLECLEKLRQLLSQEGGVLRVVGEEDLLALPAIALCRGHDYVVYGNWQGFMQIIPCGSFFKHIAFRLLKRYFRIQP